MLSFSGLVESFHAGLNISVIESSRTGSINDQFHANTAIDDITHHFPAGAASNRGEPLKVRKSVIQ